MFDRFDAHLNGDSGADGHLPPLNEGGGLFESFQSPWQWDELAAEINQESQARVALAGLVGAGKSLLFNRLRGWTLSDDDRRYATNLASDDYAPTLETYGAFVLADLPDHLDEPYSTPSSLLMALGDPALIVYVLDATREVQQIDYQWVSLLRASGRPVIAVLNKLDALRQPAADVSAGARHRLGMPVLFVSALRGDGVESDLLPAMINAVPKLAVTLGREIQGLRRHAARRVIRQAALFSGLISAQPLPMLDIPVQAMVQSGVVLRVGAAYGHAPTGGLSREVLAAVANTLLARYVVQTALKFIPILGWLVSGVIGGLSTLFVGEAAIRYYEAGGTIPLREALRQVKRPSLARPGFLRRKEPVTDELIEVASCEE